MMACPGQDCPCGDRQIEVTQPLAIDKTSAGQSLDSYANNVRHEGDNLIREPAVDHDELLAKIDGITVSPNPNIMVFSSDYVRSSIQRAEALSKALRAVVELHKPYDSGRKTYPGGNREGVKSIICFECSTLHAREFRYPYPTIQAIEKETIK